MGQLLDEAHRVHDHDLSAAPEKHAPHQGIEGHEELIRHPRPAAGEGVEQRRLAGVRVPHQSHHRHLAPPAGLASGEPLAPHVLDVPSHHQDALPDPAPVGLQLRLTGAPRPDPAAQPREKDPPSRQPRQEVLELGQLHLQPPLPRARPVGEDVEDQLRAVEGLDPDRLLDVPLLGRRQLLVDDEEVGVQLLRQGRDLLDLPASDERRRVAARPFLHDRSDHGRTRAAGEQLQLLQGLLGALALSRPESEPYDERSLSAAVRRG